MFRWHILTGEYPPQPGGVSDYTRLVARSLAEAGDEVHVYAPESAETPADCGVHLHHLSGQYGAKALAELDGALPTLVVPSACSSSMCRTCTA